MKKMIVVLVLLGLACSNSTKLAGLFKPGAEPTFTAEPLATEMLLPIATLPPSSTIAPPVIDVQNAGQIVKTGEMQTALVRRVVFSPDSKNYATAEGNDNDYGVHVWQSGDGSLQKTLLGFTGIV